MFDEGTKPPQYVKGSSLGVVRSAGMVGSGFGFSSPKPVVDNITAGLKLTTPVTNTPQEVYGSHDVTTSSHDKATPTGSGSSKRKGATTERERHKEMKNMHNDLRSILPGLPQKADKATILGEAVNYIKTLQDKIQRLQRLKLEQIHAQQLVQLGLSVAHLPSLRHGTAAPTAGELIMADMVQSLNAQQTAACLSGSSVMPRVAVNMPPSAGPFQTLSGPNVAVSVTGDDGFINMCIPRQYSLMKKVCSVLEKHRIDLVRADISSDKYQSKISIHARINSASAHFLEDITAEVRYKLAVSEMVRSLAN